MESTVTTQLERLLLRIQLLISGSSACSPSSEQQEVFNSICKLVFKDQTCRNLWDESILSRLNWLFQVKPPQQTVFGGQVEELRQRLQQVQEVNNLFFAI